MTFLPLVEFVVAEVLDLVRLAYVDVVREHLMLVVVACQHWVSRVTLKALAIFEDGATLVLAAVTFAVTVVERVLDTADYRPAGMASVVIVVVVWRLS